MRKVRVPLECVAILLGWLVIPAWPRCCVTGVATFAGWLMSIVCIRQTRIMAANLEIMYGDALSDAERRRIIRGAGASAARVLLDFFWFSWFTRRRVMRYVTATEAFERVVMDPKGALLVSSHFGNWELAALRGILIRGKAVSVFAKLGTPFAQRMMLRLRTRLGLTMVPRSGAMVALLRAVREGLPMAVLLDQHVGEEEGGMWVDFMGKPALISSVAGVLSVKRQVTVNLITPRYVAGGRVHVDVAEIMPPETATDVAAVTQWVADAMARQIRKDPTQWFLMYRRWRDVKPGTDISAYPFYVDKPRK
ncbi:MAG: lysophospholipid acyltransferase family protein [Kiritimatiellaeota bacterium]|nr:lysophospholipid acyltransferase family protein [Kiritimatiellota bacterium]